MVPAPGRTLLSPQDGIIRYWKAACERIGFTSADVCGQSLDIIIPKTYARGIGKAGRKPCALARRATAQVIASRFRRWASRTQSSSRSCRSHDPAGAIMREVTKRFETLTALRKAAAASCMA